MISSGCLVIVVMIHYVVRRLRFSTSHNTSASNRPHVDIRTVHSRCAEQHCLSQSCCRGFLSGSCRHAIMLFSTFRVMLSTNKSPQAKHSETEPPPWHAHDGTPPTARTCLRRELLPGVPSACFNSDMDRVNAGAAKVIHITPFYKSNAPAIHSRG